MSLQDLYNSLNAAIGKLSPGQPLQVGYDLVSDDRFYYLILLMRQTDHFTIYNPKLTWVNDQKELDLTGELLIYNASAADGKLAFTEDADNNLVTALSGTLPSLNMGDMASLKLIDPKADSVAYFPNLQFNNVAMQAASDTLAMSIDALSKNSGWSILGLPLFPLKDIGYSLTATIVEGVMDPLPQFWFLGDFQLGQTLVRLKVKIPVSSMDTQGQWTATFSVLTPLNNTFQDLSNLLFFNNLNNSVPNQLLTMKNDPEKKKGIYLDQLEVQFGLSDRSIRYLNINVAAYGEWQLGPITLLYASLLLGFVPATTASGMQFSIFFDLQMQFGSPATLLDLSLSIPAIKDNWTVTLQDDGQMSSMDDIKNIPGSVDKSQFHFPAAINAATDGLSLKDFTAVFNPYAGTWDEVNIEISYTKEWYVIPDFFKVTDIDLQLNVANGGAGNGVVVTGYFETDVFVGTKATGFPMHLYVEKRADSWFFSVSAEKIKLTDIIQSLLDGAFTLPPYVPKIVVDYIKLSIDTGTKIYTGAGSISAKWPVYIAETYYDLDVNVSANITSDRSVPGAPKNSGFIKGIINVPDAPGFGNAALTLTYTFGKDDVYEASFMGVTVSFYASTGLINLNLGDITLGDIVSKMISWAAPNSSATLEAPWDILNDISLKGLNFFFNIKDKSFGFEYKPGNGLNLGIVTINGIGLKYVKVGNEYQVQMLLDGQLFGQPIPAWDVLNPDTAPKVPGRGSENFDLKFLALGQHVSLKDSASVTSLDDAIKRYGAAFQEPKSPDKVPIDPQGDVVFNANSNWLIGARFLIMNAVDIGVIFNDPELYGLLIKLNGEKAKIFSGLSFQIIYKKISDTIGVYEIELKLPDAMRHIEFGAVSITLPVLGLQVYTNGNFRVDFGFPWNNDFSRSFTVQAFPFIGSGGFYFAWLSGDTSTNVPRITSGNFNPVIEFGIGLALGVGKTIDEGILSGGLSVTVTGILQGVIGFYNPNPVAPGVPATSGANYYAIQGTFSIVGRVYGSIDFAIIKASVDIMVYALVRITYICYEPIIIYLEAGVTVRVTVSIDLGLFSINIHLSFSATIKTTFTVGSASTPPWTLATQQSRRLLRAHHTLLYDANPTPVRQIEMQWIPLKYTQPTDQPPVSIYFVPSLTVALDEKNPTPTQVARYMTMLYIDTTNPDQTSQPVSSFTKLASGIVAWAINADITDKTWQTDIYDEVLAQKVDLNYLQNIYTYFNCQADVNIPVDKINDFLQNGFNVSLIYRNTKSDQLYGSVFPMFPLLNLAATLDGKPYGDPVDFASFNTVSQEYQEGITKYFERISVDYLNPLEASADGCSLYQKATPADAENSMAGFIYADYFLLLAKGGIGEAIKLMKSYPYSYQGELLNTLAAEFGITAAAIALSNKSVVLSEALQLTITGTNHITDGSETLNLLSTDYGETVTDLIALSRTLPVIKGGITVALNDASNQYTTIANDNFQNIANKLSTNKSLGTMSGSIPDLVTLSNIAGLALFETTQTLLVQPPVYHIAQDDTIQSVVNRYNPQKAAGNMTIYDFCNINAITTGLLSAGAKVPLGTGDPYVIASTDTLLILADKFTSGNMNDLADKIAALKILQPLTPAFLPKLVYTTGKTDSFESISNQFLLPIETVTGNNPASVNLWPLDTNIFFTNIGAISIGKLIDKLQSSGGLDNLSGMAARFLLNGLRLPSPKELSTARAKAAKAKTAKAKAWETTLDTYPIYELTGQLVVLPTLTTSNQFGITLAKDTGLASWINFEIVTTQLTGNTGIDALPVTLETEDINRVIAIQAEVLNPAVDVLRPMPSYMETGKQFNFSNPASWQYNSAVPLWPDMPAGTIPSIWPMSDALLQAAFQHKQLIPLVKLEVGTHDNPNAPLTTTPVANYDWALQVPLTVSRLPKDSSGADASSLPHVYQVDSTNEAGLVYLERLIVFNKAQKADILKAVHILYPPNPSGNSSKGLQSNGLDITTAFVVKTNFSTESNPVGAMDVLNADTVVLNSTPADFVEKVWEASIVQTGGFYLYYGYGADNQELPASLFNGSTSATLQLLITFNDNLPKDFIYDFMNAVAIGENINSGNSILFAAAQDQSVSYPYGSTDTFAHIASQYNILVDDLGRTLQDNTLVNNIPFTITGIQYEVKPGDTLDGIAAYFGQGQPGNFKQLITNANPGLQPTDYSVVWTMVNIPSISFTTGSTISTLTTLRQISVYYFIDIAALSNQVQLTAGLFTGTITFTDKSVDRLAVIAPGNAGIEMQRETPDDPAAMLPPMFNLLGVSVAANGDFNASGDGLPATSRKLDTNVPGSLLLAKADVDKIWQYLKTVSIASFAIKNNMVKDSVIADLYSSNPYAGVGGTVQIAMEWLDLYGNHTKTPFSFPDQYNPLPKGPLNHLPVKVRYTDQLVSIDKWPNLAANFVYQGSNNIASLDLIFNFDVSKYAVYKPTDPSAKVNPSDPSSPTRGEQFASDMKAALVNAKTDLQTYRNIYYQVWQDDVSITITDTVSNQEWALNAAQMTQMRSLLNGIYNYLAAIINAGIVYNYYTVVKEDLKDTPYDTAVFLATKLNVPDVNALIRINLGLTHPFGNNGVVNPDYEIIVPAIVLPAVSLLTQVCPDNNADMIFELTCSITIARNPGLVDDNFADVAGVGSAKSNVKPISNSLADSLAQYDNNFDKEDSNQLALTAFAGYFEGAYNSQYKDRQYKIATGTPLNDVVSNNGSKQLWVIRFGQNGIQYTVSGQPIYFSPTPLANSLLSFTGDKAVPIRPFDKTSGLGTPANKNFAGVNLDAWGSTFLEAVDQFLLPQYAVPAYIVDQNAATAAEQYLPQIMGAKETLAKAIVSNKLADPANSRFLNILDSPAITADALTEAQETLRQLLLIKLANAYSVDAVVQFNATVVSQYPDSSQPVAPNLYGQPFAKDIVTAKDDPAEPLQVFSLSTSKVPLTNGSSNLTFTFSTKNKQDQKNFVLDLFYQVNHIEYDITPVTVTGFAGAEKDDYNASTWLSMVTPMDPVQVIVSPADPSVEIPVPLRTYPTPPSLISQLSVPHKIDQPDEKGRLDELLQWQYTYTYSQVESVQDSMNTQLQFNILPPPKTGLMALPPEQQLFGNLAQFNEVYAAIQEVFAAQLSIITPASKTSDMDSARVALKAFASIVTDVANSWENWNQPVAADFVVVKLEDTYKYHLKEDKYPYQGTEGIKEVLSITVTRMDQAVFAFPSVQIDGFVPVQPDKSVARYIFMDSTTGEPLLWNDRQKHKQRTLQFDFTNILCNQNAWASVAELRNFDLVDGNPTVSNFIYQTPDVRFANYLVPYIDTINYPTMKPFDIYKLYASSPGPSDKLETILSNLFQVLFSSVTNAQKIKLGVNYEYALTMDADAMRISLPFYITPPLPFTIPADYTSTPGCSDSASSGTSFVCQLAYFIRRWFTDNDPVTNNAIFLFDLSVYSSLDTNQQMPILRIRNFYLNLANISNPKLLSGV